MSRAESLPLVTPTARPTFMRLASIAEPVIWLGPGLLVFVVFVYLPMLLQIALSFASVRLDDGRVGFVGLDNFRLLLSDIDYWNALLNNLQYAVGTVVGKVVVSLALALALNDAFSGRNALRTIFFLPVILSMVATGIVWGFMYQSDLGAINQGLKAIGLGFLAQDWLGNPRFALCAVIVVDIWKWSGFHMVIFLAGLQGLPQEVGEAAAIDGASAWQRLRLVTLPMLSRYTATNVVLATLGALGVFDLIYVMTRGGPIGATQVAMMQVYLEAFQFQNIGYASAESTVLLAIIAVISAVILRFTRRADDK